MIKEIDKLKAFENFRKETIDLLEESKIDKDKFLHKNLDYIRKLDLKPFSNIKNVEEAIYNYQYYNLLAKKSNAEAKNIVNNYKKRKLYARLINERENYYCLKDIATQRILELLDYKFVESYFIILNSKRLKGEIFEINIKSEEKLILHSKNKKILNELKDHGVFLDYSKPSLIDSYVNKSY